MNWQHCFFLSTALASMAAATASRAQEPSTINFIVSGPADWNSGINWDLNDVPGFGDFTAEVAGVSNGGTAVLNNQAENLIRGVVLGESGQFPDDNPAQEGTLVLDGAGLLLTATDVVRVGDQGVGTLNLLGGALVSGTLTVSGAAQSSLNLSGSSSVSTGDASLLRTTRIRGPDVNFEVSGVLTVEGTFISEITGPAHSRIDAGNSTANLSGNLQVLLDGHSPAMGDSFTLIDAMELNGQFDSLDVAGASLQPGLGYNLLYNSGGNGDVVLAVTNVLTLVVDRANGAASIKNTFGTISFDGYSIASPGGSLDVDDWDSLQDSGVPGWEEANPSANRLNELNLPSASTLAADEMLSLGEPFQIPQEFGQGSQDLTFEYHVDGGDTLVGNVQYTGPHNTLVLLVDPATGEARITNDSAFDVDIDAYSIASLAGSLDETAWMSFADAGLDGGNWQEANPTSTHLSELNLLGMTALTGGQSINIGNPFDTGVGVTDLTFDFHVAGGLTVPGVVEYGSIMSQLIGDTNGDGAVNIDDLNNVRNNFGADGPADGTLVGDAFPFDGMVNIDDLNGVRNNFGAMAAAVPEPASVLMASIALLMGLPLRRAAAKPAASVN